MPNLVIEVENEVQLNRWFDRFEGALKDLTPVWPEVTKAFYKVEEDQFNTEGQGKWAPLSPRYARWKAAHAPGRSLLVLEGRLKAAATGGAGAIANQTPTELQLGLTGVPYFTYHQRGTSHMPQRKVIDLTEEGKMAIMKAFHKSMIDQIRRAT
jgi:phage gpG-like protein